MNEEKFLTGITLLRKICVHPVSSPALNLFLLHSITSRRKKEAVLSIAHQRQVCTQNQKII
jgi:hypothetical protein